MYGWLITKVMSARYGNEVPVKIWFRHLRLVKGRKEIEEKEDIFLEDLSELFLNDDCQ